jgi:hypothetical protein
MTYSRQFIEAYLGSSVGGSLLLRLQNATGETSSSVQRKCRAFRAHEPCPMVRGRPNERDRQAFRRAAEMSRRRSRKLASLADRTGSAPTEIEIAADVGKMGRRWDRLELTPPFHMGADEQTRFQFVYDVLFGRLRAAVKNLPHLIVDQLVLFRTDKGFWKQPGDPNDHFLDGAENRVIVVTGMTDDRFVFVDFHTEGYFNVGGFIQFMQKLFSKLTILKGPGITFLDHATFQDCDEARQFFAAQGWPVVPGWPPRNSKLPPVQTYFDAVLKDIAAEKVDREDLKKCFDHAQTNFEFKPKDTILERIWDLHTYYRRFRQTETPFSPEIDQAILRIVNENRWSWEHFEEKIGTRWTMIKERYRLLNEIAFLEAAMARRAVSRP